MFNFITLTITIWTQAKYDYKLLHDFHKLRSSQNVSVTRRSKKFAAKVGKMHKFTKMPSH